MHIRIKPQQFFDFLNHITRTSGYISNSTNNFLKTFAAARMPLMRGIVCVVGICALPSPLCFLFLLKVVLDPDSLHDVLGSSEIGVKFLDLLIGFLNAGIVRAAERVSVILAARFVGGGSSCEQRCRVIFFHPYCTVATPTPLQTIIRLSIAFFTGKAFRKSAMSCWLQKTHIGQASPRPSRPRCSYPLLHRSGEARDYTP